jgi:hypothetical protein
MTSTINKFSAGMSYENFLRRLSTSSNASTLRCAGEMEHLLAIEDGSGKRIKGQLTQSRWLEDIRKKVLKAYDRLLKNKGLISNDREAVVVMRAQVERASSAHEIYRMIESTWPIVLRILPNNLKQ